MTKANLSTLLQVTGTLMLVGYSVITPVAPPAKTSRAAIAATDRTWLQVHTIPVLYNTQNSQDGNIPETLPHGGVYQIHTDQLLRQALHQQLQLLQLMANSHTNSNMLAFDDACRKWQAHAQMLTGMMQAFPGQLRKNGRLQEARQKLSSPLPNFNLFEKYGAIACKLWPR